MKCVRIILLTWNRPPHSGYLPGYAPLPGLAAVSGRVGRCGAGQQFSSQTSCLGPRDPSALLSIPGSVRSTISSRIIPMNFGCTPTVLARAIGSGRESQS